MLFKYFKDILTQKFWWIQKHAPVPNMVMMHFVHKGTHLAMTVEQHLHSNLEKKLLQEAQFLSGIQMYIYELYLILHCSPPSANSTSFYCRVTMSSNSFRFSHGNKRQSILNLDLNLYYVDDNY